MTTNAYITNHLVVGARRALLLAVATFVIAIGLVAVYLFVLYFFNTSYRFVSIFLLLILISNLLAKIRLSWFDLTPIVHDLTD